MTTIGLELVDAALMAVRDGVRVAASPGVALIDPEGLLVGEAAAAATRLRPVLATDRFWADLATDAMVQTVGSTVSHADLAHAHLSQLWNSIARPETQVVLAVPGTMRLPQIGLLLGLAKSIAMPVAGIVDSAVAACADLPARATVLHLDIHLHQAVLTEMQGGSLLQRGRVEVTPRAGQTAMHGAWAQLISEAMVRRTRFDPLHRAESEQLLYERLPGWLQSLATQETINVSIETGSNSFTATLRREQFALAADAYYAQLVELVQAGRRAGTSATLVLSSRAAALPALRERFAAISGLELVTLPDTTPAASAAARVDDIGPGDPPALVTALPRRLPVATSAVPASRAVPHRRPRLASPTHVILESRAHAIDEQPLVLGQGEADAAAAKARRLVLTGRPAGVSRSHCTLLRRDGTVIVRDHSRYGSFVNDERVDGEAVLGAGDRLRLGTPGVVLELVAVA